MTISKETPRPKITPLDDIMSAAEADHQFGQLDAGMAEFYENEARAQKPTTPYVVFYDNGDDMQECHGKLVNIPDGEDPWEYARMYLSTITSPGHNGLFVEEIGKLKPGEEFEDF